MKKIFTVAILLCTMITFAQNERTLKLNEDTNLYEVTYFYENGNIEQQGTFNLEGKLHGVWTSYDMEGEKLAVGNYVDGEKSGKWFFWSKDNMLKEVDYNDARITSVSEWKNTSQVTYRQ